MRPPKAHSKIEQGTIEAWLISDDPDEQRLATESFLHMSSDGQKAFYKNLLYREHEACFSQKTDDNSRRVLIVGGLLMMVSAYFQWQVLYVLSAMSIIASIIVAVAKATQKKPLSLLQQQAGTHFAAQADATELHEVLRFMCANEEAFVLMRPALLRLLPRLTPESREVVPLESWDVLGHLATRPEKQGIFPVDAELRRAIVHGIGKAGGERMRPVLKMAANTSEDESLRQLAANYLSILPQTTLAEDELNDVEIAVTPQSLTGIVEQEPLRQQIAGRG